MWLWLLRMRLELVVLQRKLLLLQLLQWLADLLMRVRLGWLLMRWLLHLLVLEELLLLWLLMLLLLLSSSRLLELLGHTAAPRRCRCASIGLLDVVAGQLWLVLMLLLL